MSAILPGGLPGAIPVFSPLTPVDGTANAGAGFGDVLKNALNQVSTLQGTADQQISTMLQGGNADMGKVMISVEKADVAFQLMMQVRNKIVTAYQDIEKMQF